MLCRFKRGFFACVNKWWFSCGRVIFCQGRSNTIQWSKWPDKWPLHLSVYVSFMTEYELKVLYKKVIHIHVNVISTSLTCLIPLPLFGNWTKNHVSLYLMVLSITYLLWDLFLDKIINWHFQIILRIFSCFCLFFSQTECTTWLPHVHFHVSKEKMLYRRLKNSLLCANSSEMWCWQEAKFTKLFKCIPQLDWDFRQQRVSFKSWHHQLLLIYIWF